MAGEDRGPQVAGVAGTFLALSWLLTLARCYCRIGVVKSFGSDDYIAIMAQVFYTFFCTFALLGVKYGTGRHTVDIHPPTNVPIGLKWWWACEPMYVLSSTALKFSVAIFLLRIAVSKTQRYILWSTVIASGVMGGYFFLLFIFQCWPVNYFWTRYTGSTGTCINPNITIDSVYAYSAVCCVADWTCVIVPGFMVWQTQMNRRTKVIVILILGLSAIASAATILRFPYISGLRDTADFLWATTDVAIWSLSECGLGITCAAAATLRPLFRTYLSRSNYHLGTDSNHGSAMPWQSNRPSRSNYIRSEASNRYHEDLEMRPDVGANNSVVTEINGKRNNRGVDKNIDLSFAKDKKIHVMANDASSDSSSKEELAPTVEDGIWKTTVVETKRQ